MTHNGLFGPPLYDNSKAIGGTAETPNGAYAITPDSAAMP